jgi:hypothetical protein
VIPTVFIGSFKGSQFLPGCIDSIPGDMECIVIRNGGYECGALRWIQQNFNGPKFLFIQDSARIKNPVWIYDAFKDEKSYSLNDETGFMSMFSGVYRTELFKQLILPVTNTKLDAVMAEMQVGNAYGKLDPQTEVLWPELRLENARSEMIDGREYRIYENEYFWKAKGCWGGWMLDDVCAMDAARRAKYDSTTTPIH